MIKKIGHFLAKVYKSLRRHLKKDFKILLPQIYFLLLIISFILILLYATFPSFYICSKLFGYEFCTPTGVFVALLLNIPGYLFAGNILVKISEVHWSISLIAVIITSIVFYRLLGIFMDKFKKGGYEERVRLMIISIFIILLFILLLLVL